ncbi:MAG: outer membrane beta-barrel protein [bacterium]|nr:outer membrane beta-barrel protein [bacterium]MDT8365661.1 outer membrane beta-barrel protein [bacterium]
MKALKVGTILLAVLLLAFTLLAAVPAQAGQWYVGGGINTVDLGKDFSDIESGQGLTFNFGYYFQPTFALDFVLGFSGHEDPFGDDFLYSRFDIGAEFAFGTGSGLSPYLVVGLGSHTMDYDLFTDSFTGTSLF